MISIETGTGKARSVVVFDKGEVSVAGEEPFREHTRSLAAMIAEDEGETYGPQHGDPDRYYAEQLIGLIGGTVLSYDPPPDPEGDVVF